LLMNFGPARLRDSDKPVGAFGPEGHASDMLALPDALGIDKAGVVGHDVGGVRSRGAEVQQMSPRHAYLQMSVAI
jgi:pimeloyl-ACP methyl ester carboxylesterase